MKRINTSTAVGHQFVPGNPQIGQAATQLSAEWCNSVQETLCKVIEDAGITIDPDEDDVVANLKNAIATMVTAGVNAAIGPHITQLGEGKWMHANTYNATYYKVPDGTALSRDTYAALWTAVQASGMLAADATDKTNNPGKWGPGDGTTTFQLPDLRDQFLRIYKGAKAGALGPALGVFKANQNKQHNHTVAQAPSLASTGSITSGDDFSNTVDHTINTGDSGGDEAVPDHTSVIYVIRVL